MISRDPDMQIFEDDKEISKQIFPELGENHDISKIIKLQSLFRMVLAQRKLVELRRRHSISLQQKSLSSNKQKVIALRVISKFWM